MPYLAPPLRPERPADGPAIDAICDAAFGPGAQTRAAAWLREGVMHRSDLSFVAERDGALVGTVRLTPIRWGGKAALMLGPLAVDPAAGRQGIGRALMGEAMNRARWLTAEGSPPVVLLVGDHAYYRDFGFEPVPPSRVRLPRPADPARVLACELVPGALDGFRGAVERAL